MKRNLILLSLLLLMCMPVLAQTPEELYQKGIKCMEDKDIPGALDCFQEAADKGHPLAQYEMYKNSNPFNLELEKANKYLNKAAKQKVPEAMHRLAGELMYKKHSFIAIKNPKSEKLYREAAEMGYAPSCMEYADHYVDKLEDKIAWYQKAFELKDIKAAMKFASCYKKGKWDKLDFEVNYEKAFYYFQKAIDFGSYGAYFDLGEMYMEGKGVQQDYAKARECFEKSPKLVPSEWEPLITIYLEGLGTPKDYVKAMEYCRNATTCIKFARDCFKKYKNTNTNYSESLKFIGKYPKQDVAVISEDIINEQEYVEALKNYITLTEAWKKMPQGKGKKLSLDKHLFNNGVIYYRNGENASAVLCFYGSALKGNKWAQFHLAECFRFGEGVKPNIALAKEWYTKAAANGIEAASKALDKIKDEV